MEGRSDWEATCNTQIIPTNSKFFFFILHLSDVSSTAPNLDVLPLCIYLLCIYSEIVTGLEHVHWRRKSRV